MESITEEISDFFAFSQNGGSILAIAVICIVFGILSGIFLFSGASLMRSDFIVASKASNDNGKYGLFREFLLTHPLHLRWVLQGWALFFTAIHTLSFIPVFLYLINFLSIGVFFQVILLLIVFSFLVLSEYLIAWSFFGRKRDQLLKLILFLLKVYWKIARPFVFYYEKQMKARLGTFQTNQPITMSELSETIEMHDEDNPGEAKILKSIVEFGEVEVREVMKSRGEVITVDVDYNFKQLMEVVVNCGYSRMPVIDQTFDQVIGILYIKDILPYLHEGEQFDWHILVRKPYFTSESKLLSELLEEFRSEKNHIAVVVDEYGGTSGIITLEDILEEIVGDITDEMDEEEIDFSHPEPDRYIFNGKTLLNDFLRIVGEESDYYDDFRGEMESIAGLLLEKFREIPQKGAEIQIRDYIFRIKSADTRRIKQIEVIVNKNK